MKTQGLTPIEQKQVLFYDDEIIAVKLDDNEIYVPIRPVCDLLGLSWPGQRQRINRDPVLSQEMTLVCVTHTGHAHGQHQDVDMSCLPLKFMSGFLFGISASRVKAELRERLITYQRECYEVLNEAFQEGRLTSEPSFSTLLESNSPATQAYKMAEAIMRMARQQIMFEAQIADNSQQITEHNSRLETIEEQLGNPKRQITPSQAMQISQAVLAIANTLSKRSGRNEYGGVYGELYRRYSINSYKVLPASQFDSAMNWLNQWLQMLNNDNDEVAF